MGWAPGGAQIDDGKPRMAERHTGRLIHPHPLGVGPPMAQRAGHARGQRLQLIVAGTPLGIEKPRNSAHYKRLGQLTLKA